MQVQLDMPIPNTLALPARAKAGIRASSVAQVQEALAYSRKQNLPFLALGEGSNVVAHRNVAQFVCLMGLTGIDLVAQTHRDAVIDVAAGENWHHTVTYALAHGWYGLENLALIPGSAGAAPVQNIGAYGVEIARFVEAVEYLDAQGRLQWLDAQACEFSYRYSIFKKHRDWVITRLRLRLQKQPRVVIDYPELQADLAAHQHLNPSPENVFAAIKRIRANKLPDVNRAPNAGSFFKNPIVQASFAAALKTRASWLKVFPQGDTTQWVKLSAAQLIDQLGWKSRPAPEVMCWEAQPLVLVNRGKADSDAVLDFAEAIRRNVLAHFGVQLELEPSVLS
ncbi:MAG: UDP-N-acetylmuramate dehydrogenase [bacterium]